MKTRISALMDGELEAHELPPVFDAIVSSESLRQDWCRYGLIGDAIRREPNLDIDLAARVMAGLQNEPTILVPSRVRGPGASGQVRRAMAMAASFAGVGVVAWLALSMSATTLPLPAQQQAQVASTASAVKAASPASASSSRMREYLVAHQTYAPAGQMQGGTRYIRTVAAER